MELYLFRHDDFNRLYNCSTYSIDDVPLAQRTHTSLGVSFIVQFVIFELAYVPCLFAIWKHMDQACYKFMFFIGIVDVLCLFICAFMHGYFAITGTVFCSYPDLIYWSGVVGFFFWVIESSVDILLAVNRCVEMSSPLWGDRLFRGNKAWLWLIPPTAYATYIAITQMPILFSGIYFSWFFNPHVGYIDDFGAVYYNNWQTFHNWLVFFGLTSAYVVFTAVFCIKTASAGAYSRSSRAQKATFLQVLAISCVNTFCGLIYIYMQFFRISEFIIYMGSFFWVWAHGLPALIYLTMNKTIRREIVQMLDSNRASGSKVGPVQHGVTQGGNGNNNSSRMGTVNANTKAHNQQQNNTLPVVDFH